MNDSRISVRYSRALFQSALENKILDRINRDMILIKNVCADTEIKEFLSNPVIRPSKKTEILENMLAKEVDKLTLSMIRLVVKNGRERFLPAIARAFVHDTMKYNDITESLLTTAVKVDPEIKKQISDLIANHFKTKVDLKETIDETIIGGFILRVDDSYIDASVRNRLRKIKKELGVG